MSQRILVIDDDPTIGYVLCELLEFEGFGVTLAVGGQEALDGLGEPLPNVILLDLAMPGMDGVTFATELDRRGLRPGIPLIVLSAAYDRRAQCERIRADASLSKPFVLRTLLTEISRLANHPPAPTAGAPASRLSTPHVAAPG